MHSSIFLSILRPSNETPADLLASSSVVSCEDCRVGGRLPCHNMGTPGGATTTLSDRWY